MASSLVTTCTHRHTHTAGVMRNVLTCVRISDGDADSIKYFSTATNTVEPPPLPPFVKNNSGIVIPSQFFIHPLSSSSVVCLYLSSHLSGPRLQRQLLLFTFNFSP